MRGGSYTERQLLFRVLASSAGRANESLPDLPALASATMDPPSAKKQKQEPSSAPGGSGSSSGGGSSASASPLLYAIADGGATYVASGLS